MKRFYFLVVFLLLVSLFTSGGICNAGELNKTEEEFTVFLDNYMKFLEPLLINDARAYWNATASGKDEDYAEYEKYEVQYTKYHSNKAEFAKVKSFKDSGMIKDHMLARQLTYVYIDFLSNQTDPELLEQIVKLSTEIEKIFNKHRGMYQGKEVSDNELLEVLSKETDSAKRKEAWSAQKTVGKEVAPLLIKLVKLRNKAARDMGYKNYYEMEMELSELNISEVFKIFDELAELTDEPFKKLKMDVIDKKLSKMWGISPDEMRPWHYQDFFFQESPKISSFDLDSIFVKHDIVKLIADFYNGINLNVNKILEKSDLYERKDKYQHAYCTDIDRSGDVRTMCNLRNNEYWADTLLHELGHGVYSYYTDRSLPFLLRDSAHIFVTEGIAQMFESSITNPEWLIKAAGAPEDEINKIKADLLLNQRLGKLIFCRWSEVAVHFERALYENPDQDLNKLWWDMVEKYQFVRRPEGRDEPDWASKIHFTSSPVYYHNYLLGELFGSQLRHAMVVQVLKKGRGRDIAFVGYPELGAFLIAKVFYPGQKYTWQEMIKQATGEYLTPKYYVEDWVKE